MSSYRHTPAALPLRSKTGGRGWVGLQGGLDFMKRQKCLVPAGIRALFYSLVAIHTEVSRPLLGLVNAHGFLFKYKEILRNLYIKN
jgi:hypothetical protein